MKRAAALVTGALVTVAVSGACSGGNNAEQSRAPVVVPGPASAWSSVTVNAGPTSKEVPAGSRRQVVPLLAARALDRPGALSDYGLDRPRASLAYQPATSRTPAAEVDVGNANFDRHFVYVQRRGRPTVYLVPADTLRQVLALVGIADRPPDD